MKILFTILFTVLFYFNCISQHNQNSTDWEWAPINTVWMYETANMDKNNKDIYARYWYVRSDKDTVINEINCRKLDVTWHYYPDFEPVSEPARFTYQDGGKIYFFNEEINDFVLSFDYNIVKGDTVEWQRPVYENCKDELYLDTVISWNAGILSGEGTPYTPYSVFLNSSVPINTYRLIAKTNSCYSNSITTGSNYSHGRLLDYMGPRSDIFEPTLLEELSTSCMCYFDGEVKINPASYDFINNDTIVYYQDSCIKYYNLLYNRVKTNNFNQIISIYPNPFTQIIKISSSKIERGLIEIFDISGNIVFSRSRIDEEEVIDLEKLNSGIYFVRITGDNNTSTKKIIKL